MAPMTFHPGFHYGGSLSKKGRLSSFPQQGAQMRRLALVEKIARLDLGIIQTGVIVPDADIGRMVGRSRRTITQIRTSVEYLRMRTQIQTGIVLQESQNVEDIRNYRVQYFKDSLPIALKVIVEEMERPANTIQERKLKIDLVKDFMDREGSFPRISRTDSHVKVEHNYEEADRAASALLQAMDGPAQNFELDPKIQRVLNASASFTNSETISTSMQEEALATLEELAPISNAIN